MKNGPPQAYVASHSATGWWVFVGNTVQAVKLPDWFHIPSEAWIGPWNPQYPDVPGWKNAKVVELD